jgi:hypothetical protein
VPGIFDRIFNRGEKPVTSHDLKVALRGVHRERKKKQLEMRRLSSKSDDHIQRLKDARKVNNKEEVDFLYEELQQLKIDQGMSRREAKVLNLEAIGLKRYVRALERLEKAQNKTRIQDLIERVRLAGLDESLSKQQLEEGEYLDRLNVTLEDMKDILSSEEGEFSDEDPDKAAFMKDLDQIIVAEEEGNEDLAIEKHEKLKAKLEEEPKNEAEG